MDCPYHCGSQHFFLPLHELLQKVYGHIIVWREVDPHIGGHEVENFPFGSVFGSKFLGRDIHIAGLTSRNLLHIDIKIIHSVSF
jgi:hypothetical protein